MTRTGFIIFGKFLFSLSVFLIAFSCSQKKEEEKISNIDSQSLNKPKVEINQYPAPDQSPMDMSYYPPGFPLQKMKVKRPTEPVARIIYSRPHKKGRIIFGDNPQSLCQYGKPWRLGANEASEIEFFRDVNIAGNMISKGRYIIYCIPYEDKWTIKLNSNLYSWGLQIDSTMDVFKTDIPTLNLDPALEDLTIVFMPAGYGMDLIIAWDNVKAILPVKL